MLLDYISPFIEQTFYFIYLLLWIFGFVYALGEGWAYLMRVVFGTETYGKKTKKHYDTFQD